MSEVRLSIKLLEVVRANLERILENPFLGAEWLPIAETLVKLFEDPEVDTVPFHCCLEGYECESGDHGGPTATFRFLSDKSVVMRVKANDSISRRLKRKEDTYELMEFLGFTAPRNAEGGFAIEPGTRSVLYDKDFVRVYKDGFDPVEAAELALYIMTQVYCCKYWHRFHFGRRDFQVNAVENIGVLERCDHQPIFAPYFWVRGKHKCANTRNKTKKVDASE